MFNNILDMNYKKLNYKEISKELYDKSKIGVFILRNILSNKEALSLKKELILNNKNYVSRKEFYGTTRQKLSSWDFEIDVMKNYKYMSILKKRYEYIRDSMSVFSPDSFKVDEICTNSSFYKKGSCGIGPHIDNSFSVNIIFICIISGMNEFCVSADKKKRKEKKMEISPGDIILMRGPRSDGERDMRPIHYVEKILEDRYIITFREINYEKMHKVSGDHQYNI